MFKLLKNDKGQHTIVEYAVTFFLVVAVVSAMTVYFRRVVQGRIRDTARTMALIVNTANVGNFTYQYEPYYSQADIFRQTDSTDTRSLVGTLPAPSEIYRTDLDERTTTQSLTEQSSPRFGN